MLGQSHIRSSQEVLGPSRIFSVFALPVSLCKAVLTSPIQLSGCDKLHGSRYGLINAPVQAVMPVHRWYKPWLRCLHQTLSALSRNDPSLQIMPRTKQWVVRCTYRGGASPGRAGPIEEAASQAALQLLFIQMPLKKIYDCNLK